MSQTGNRIVVRTLSSGQNLQEQHLGSELGFPVTVTALGITSDPQNPPKTQHKLWLHQPPPQLGVPGLQGHGILQL